MSDLDKPSQRFIAISLFINLSSSLLIVFLKKWLYLQYAFPNITLTFLHFLMTSLGLFVCLTLGMFKRKVIPIRNVLSLSITFCGFVVLTNLSLQNNTVGTFQLAKVMTTPCVFFIQTFLYQKTYSTRVKLALIPIIAGVILNSFYDVQFNATGALFATSGVVATSVYQVMVGRKQHDLEVNAMQLLLYQAPLSAFLLLFMIPFFEPFIGNGGLFSHWQPHVYLLVLASCCLAFSVNLSIYWIIGNTSPITYNVVGHAKFCLTLLGGYFIFYDPLTLYQMVGIGLTFGGIVLYTHFKVEEQEEMRTAASIPYDAVSQDDENENGFSDN